MYSGPHLLFEAPRPRDLSVFPGVGFRATTSIAYLAYSDFPSCPFLVMFSFLFRTSHDLGAEYPDRYYPVFSHPFLSFDAPVTIFNAPSAKPTQSLVLSTFFFLSLLASISTLASISFLVHDGFQ